MTLGGPCRPDHDEHPTKPKTLPVLYTDDYGFHYGDIWYRGHFAAAGNESALALTAGTGKAGAWPVRVNGTHLGTVRTGAASGNQKSTGLTISARCREAGGDNVVSVLVRDMGHDEDGGKNDAHKKPRGLLSASMVGSGTTLSWRIQGVRGGENLADTMRGTLNNGGLYGERDG